LLSALAFGAYVHAIEYNRQGEPCKAEPGESTEVLECYEPWERCSADEICVHKDLWPMDQW